MSPVFTHSEQRTIGFVTKSPLFCILALLGIILYHHHMIIDILSKQEAALAQVTRKPVFLSWDVPLLPYSIT